MYSAREINIFCFWAECDVKECSVILLFLGWKSYNIWFSWMYLGSNKATDKIESEDELLQGWDSEW
jgi:hypothetical protein